MIPAPVGHQCPECVAEARREYRRGPGRQIAVANVKSTSVTKLLLVAIGIGYVWELVVAGGPGDPFRGPNPLDLFNAGGAFAPAIAAGQWWRLLTSVFLHWGLIHLAVNAYALFVLGNMIEREIGRVAMLIAFLTTGIFASATSYAFADGRAVGAGASGAVFGLVGLVVAYNYLRRHNVLAQARLRYVLTLLVINAIIGFSITAIDWRAHLGGLVAGLVAGYAVDPSRPPAVRRITAVAGIAALLVGTVVLVAFRTMQINEDPTALFR
jgi:membrane associated rhomboid family serine protease